MKSIWVAGDFFHDEYNIGSYVGKGCRFNVEETIIVEGGAGNTAENLTAICSNTPEILCFRAGFSQPKVLKRWIENGSTILETWIINKGVNQPWLIWNQFGRKPPVRNTFMTLIVSEYNKGFNAQSTPVGYADLLVLDSRYRTADSAALTAMATTSVWRCTASEYDEEYAQNFDWIVHTSHEGVIKCGKVAELKLPNCAWTQIPPAIEVVDPCGAGDTFTAALAASLTKQGKVTYKSMWHAVDFAVRAAQNVCKKPYTAVTDVKLESI